MTVKEYDCGNRDCTLCTHRKCLKGMQMRFSTFIDDETTTAGFGELSDVGDFEFNCQANWYKQTKPTVDIVFRNLPEKFEWVDKNDQTNYSVKSILVIGKLIIYLKELEKGCVYLAESNMNFSSVFSIFLFSLTIHESCVDDAKRVFETWIRSREAKS